jgi:hypothetical protein
MIVSRYIQNPLLINGLKFDLRVYAAITSIDPFRIYIYKEGLARFATQKYEIDKDDLNVFTHLTNFSVNKKNSIFKADDGSKGEGYKWSFETLKQKLEE